MTKEDHVFSLWYPGVNDNPTAVLVGLDHVRAADDIRISYDFDRDGWVVEQASVFSWDCDDEVCDPDWQEVAFVQAWGREKVNPDTIPLQPKPANEMMSGNCEEEGW